MVVNDAVKQLSAYLCVLCASAVNITAEAQRTQRYAEKNLFTSM
jgi:hypothetical protein